jgi:hypothetical protein
MKGYLKAVTLAVAMAGATLFASAPARADHVSVSIGVPGVGVYYHSGGYCDRWGCPGEYWGYPVYYGPVYYGGTWYNGPLYYRRIGGRYMYWVHGGWHYDGWAGPRPRWWRGGYRYGPALGYEYYRGHGFYHDHDRYWHGDNWRGREIRYQNRVIRHDNRVLRHDNRVIRHDNRVIRRDERHDHDHHH